MTPAQLLTTLRLPARLDIMETAALLGFREHDIPVLVRAKLIRPLGNPVQNSVKYFSSTAIETLGKDEVWLSRATILVGKHWKERNQRRAGTDSSLAV